MRKQIVTAAMTSLAFCIALITATLAVAGVEHGDVDNPQVFGNWLAGCDNVLTCTALVLPLPEGEPEKVSDLLRLERPAGPNGFVDSVMMSFGASYVFDENSLEFRVDGKTVITVAPGELVQMKLPPDALRSAAETPTRTLYSNRIGIALLMDAMTKGAVLSISAQGGKEQRIPCSDSRRRCAGSTSSRAGQER